ncbi:unnamed protein product [Brachionus calyciflorus]|uniref:Polyadenylate-binding protein n=1 Tax=Brachionus calyciflorus TaxID=104777 RepID=A0A814GDY6_9BILA|nr:unnamed protein product [Brachionus calyciflorus]
MVDVSSPIAFQNTSLYVGDLDPYVTEAQLTEKFSTVGNVALVRICRDKITRQSLGYAYVNFTQPSEAERALDTLNFDILAGKPMRIMWSQRDPAIRRSGVGNVFIKNLDKSIDNKSLYDTFSTFGNIISCKIMSDENGSKGYGFVHFETQEAAERAIKSVNNMLLNGKIVYVGHFLSKSTRHSGSDGQQKFTNLYVKNFDETFNEEKLKDVFASYGELTSVKIARDHSGKSLGYGFVNYKNFEDAAKALKELTESDENNNTNNNNATQSEQQQEHKKLYVSIFQKKSDRLNKLKKQYEDKNLKKYYGINLFVKNLDDKIDDDKLRREFTAFGQITSAKVMCDTSGRSKGFGFVCYSNSEEATRAVAEMNGRIVGTKPLYVAMAQRKEDRRKILAAQFRERILNSQYYIQANQLYQQQLQGRMNVNPYQNYQNIRGPVRRWPTPMNNTNLPQRNITQNMYVQQVGNVRNNLLQQQQQQQQKMVQQTQKNLVSTTIPGQEPLTTGMLAAAQPQEQKQMLGERLYPLIYSMYPDLAGKITGMLLEIDNAELLHMLSSNDSLKSKVEEAVGVLQAYQQGKQA